MIPLCKKCSRYPCETNYYRKGKTYYRKLCKQCITKEKNNSKIEIQLLKKSGYKKKSRCDRCGFVSKIPEQISIYYVDGNRLNAALPNLRSYCLNCVVELKYLPNNHGDLLADF